MVKSAMSAHRPANGVHDGRGLGKRRFFELPGIGNGDFRAAYALNGCVELVERLLGDAGRDLRGQAAAAPCLVDDHGPVGSTDGCHDGGVVEGAQGT